MVNNHWLAVSNTFFIFHFIYGIIIPTDELHHFSEGIPPARDDFSIQLG
jgi:hypothetical protein